MWTVWTLLIAWIGLNIAFVAIRLRVTTEGGRRGWMFDVRRQALPIDMRR